MFHIGIVIRPITLNSIAMSSQSSPGIQAYRFDDKGWGAEYTRQSNVTAAQYAAAISANVIVTGGDSSPYIHAWAWDVLSGFGTKFSNPSSAVSPGATGLRGAYINAASTVVFAAIVPSPYVAAYTFSASSGFGTKWSNPATIPTAYSYAIAVNPAGTYVAFGNGGSPYLFVYPYTTSFGTKVADPSSAVTAGATKVSWANESVMHMSLDASTPWVNSYAWSGSSFGTKFSAPAATPAATGYGIGSDAAATLVVSMNAEASGPGIHGWPWSNGYGTKFSAPSTTPGSSTTGLVFKYGEALYAVSGKTSMYAYPVSASGFGTLVSGSGATTTTTGESRETAST